MQEPRSAVEFLVQAAGGPLNRNDLGRLAQMHTACQVLCGEGGAVSAVAKRLGCVLEGLILDEIADPPGALQRIPAAAAAIARAFGGDTVDVADLSAQLEALCAGASVPAAAPTPVVAVVEAPPPAAAAPPAPRGGAAVEVEEYVGEPLVVDLAERDHLQGFIDEAQEHMDAIETALLSVERDPHDSAQINELFRPFHTIKGIAGFLNLRDINRLTHEVETILDLARKGERALTATSVDVIFAAIDRLKEQIASLARHLKAPSDGPVPQPDIRDIMRTLRQVAAGGAGPAPAGPARAATAPPPAAAPAGGARTSPAGEGAEAEKSAPVDTAIRVDTAKLDALVDAIGELVIAQTMVNLNGAVRADEKLHRDVAQVTKIVRDIQETSMAMRMVPIGHTFSKMKRLVRDVSRKAGKTVELFISGEETELDKNVIQAISDPLVHMVRNAIDHGVEPAAERAAAGKPEVGRVVLNAFYQGDNVVIEIRDDGRGLDPAKLVAKARERGVVGPDEALTEQQAFSLIFAPGFSTAAQVTDISGRGVGMDVVRRNIEKLRGKVEIQSKLGEGSSFLIRLPLTLAIIDGMLVRIGQERVIIPTILIEQSLRPTPGQITVVQRKGKMLQVRGELIPLVQLGEHFGYCGPVDPGEGLVVVAHAENHKIGIVVEELIGQQQVVIKTLGDRFKHVRGVSGAAILGDGRVGLILEPVGLLSLHNARRGPRAAGGESENAHASAGSPSKPPAGAVPAAVNA